PPYKHSMNGVVERAMQTINKIARSLIYVAKLPVEMWDYAIDHAVYLKNRHPTDALPNDPSKRSSREPMSPYKAYTGKAPEGANVRAFGTAAFLIQPKDKHPPANEPRFQESFMYVGMKGNSIYRVLNVKTLKEEWYADVKFDEYVYPATKEPIFGQLKGRKADDKAKEPVPSPHKPENVPSAKTDQAKEPQTKSIREREAPPVVQPPGQSAAAARAKPPLLESITVKIDNLDGQRINTEAAQPTPQGDNVENKKPAIEPQRRSERTPKKKSFPDSIVYSAIAMKAVHLEGNDSLGAPIAPFELVSEEEAMREDAPAWLEAIKAELNSIKEAKTYTVVGELPKGRTAI